VLIISGDKTTPASEHRQAEAIDYFNTQEHIKLSNVVYAYCNQEVSYRKSYTLISCTANLKYIWTSNDLLGFGSLGALKAHGLRPGKDVFVSTINTYTKVLALKACKEIRVLGAGHFSAAV
jgi:D-allose transport system substrate-binding protein